MNWYDLLVLILSFAYVFMDIEKEWNCRACLIKIYTNSILQWWFTKPEMNYCLRISKRVRRDFACKISSYFVLCF